ncbi:MAG: hypothetical protein WBX25_19915 [Rhodomicrobium sp.]
MADIGTSGNLHRTLDLSRGSLPLLIALAFAGCVGGIAYTAGGIMESINHNRVETATRLMAIETAIAGIRQFLAQRGCVIAQKK